MIKSKRIDSFFKRKAYDEDKKIISKFPRVTYNEFENALERNLGKRPQIWQYLPNQIDKVRRTYLKWGPYQMHLENYPLSSKDDHLKRFQYTWFNLFPSSLEFSPLKDVAYCLLCYLFNKIPSRWPGLNFFHYYM